MKLELRDDLGELLDMIVLAELAKLDGITDNSMIRDRLLKIRLFEVSQAIKAARERPLQQEWPAAFPITAPVGNAETRAIGPLLPKPSKKSIKPTIAKKYPGGSANIPTPRATPNWTDAENKILLGYEAVTPKPWNEIVQRLQDAGFTLRNQAACEARLRRLLDRRAELAARETAQRVREEGGTQVVSPTYPGLIPVSGVDADGSGHPDILEDEWRPSPPTRDQLMGKVYGR